MDPLRLIDSARDPYLRRQAQSQQAMALATSLSSGQGYYTVESLEGATSLPHLTNAPPSSIPRHEILAAEREAVLRLDSHFRSSLADRETRGVRARLLAAEREAMLRNLAGEAGDARSRLVAAQREASLKNLPGDSADARLLAAEREALLRNLPAEAARGRALSQAETRALDGRIYSDVQPPHSARVYGLPPMGIRDALDPRTGNHVDPMQARDVHVGFDSRFRALPHMGAAVTETGPFHIGRDIVDRRDEYPEPHGHVHRARSDRPIVNGSREPYGARSESVNRKHLVVKSPVRKLMPPTTNATLTGKTKIESEAWCAVCRKDLFNQKSLSTHLAGKKHKAEVEKLKEAGESLEARGKDASQSAKKRAVEANSEVPQSSKRLKAVADSLPASVVATGAPKGNPDPAMKKESASTDPAHPVCKICNIFTTGQQNLEAHLKGKRHAARVKELEEGQNV